MVSGEGGGDFGEEEGMVQNDKYLLDKCLDLPL